MSFERFDHEGTPYRLAIVRTAGGVWVGWPGGAKLFAPERAAAAVAATSHDEIRAPMTGKIVRIAVQPGATVAENDLLVILEAMKMEYRLTAPHAARVEKVLCREGDLVELGATLVDLQPPPENAPEVRGKS